MIDTQNGTLQNVITFPPDGAFVVDSTLDVKGPQRTDFKFTEARLQQKKKTTGLPPFGQGYFNSVYVDKDYRVVKDSRGDVLLVRRAGPPRQF